MRSQRLLVVWAFSASAWSCAAAQNPEGPPPSAAVERCTSDAMAQARPRLQVVAARLSSPLQHRLNVWLAEHSRARCSAAAAETLHALERRRITVEVTYTGELATLVAAGLTTGSQGGGRLTGQLEIGRLIDFAALPAVLSVDVQPDVQPNQAGASP